MRFGERIISTGGGSDFGLRVSIMGSLYSYWCIWLGTLFTFRHAQTISIYLPSSLALANKGSIVLDGARIFLPSYLLVQTLTDRPMPYR